MLPCRTSAVSALLAAVLLLATPSLALLYRSTYQGALNHGLALRKSTTTTAAAEPLWFEEQRVDHFNLTDSRTWKQRFFVNDTFVASAKSPVFLVLGGEGPISSKYVSGHFIVNDYAAQFSALIVGLEHRFYGQSMPINDSSTASLELLSAQQALADAARFREYINDKYAVSEEAPWVVFGGSYSGNLAAWAKLKYPASFHAAYATSAPVHAVEDFPQYLEVVSASVGSSCSAVVKQASDKVDALLQTAEGRAQLVEEFNVCPTSTLETAKDQQMLREQVASVVSGIVQYSDDNVDYQAYNISAMCLILTTYDSSDPLKSLAYFNSLVNKFDGLNCTDVSYEGYIESMMSTSAGRSWTYQTCTAFGYFQTGTSAKQPFSNKLGLQFFTDMCTDMFGAPLTPNTNWTNTYFGSTGIVTSNTFMPNGNVDPWHALGVLDRSPGPQSATALIDGGAHCSDLYPARATDSASLQKARNTALQLLNDWLL